MQMKPILWVLFMGVKPFDVRGRLEGYLTKKHGSKPLFTLEDIYDAARERRAYSRSYKYVSTINVF